MLDALRVRPLLDGHRGRPACDRTALGHQLAAFSVACAALAPVVGEVDVNPVIAGPEGCCAVDALVIGRSTAPGQVEASMSGT